MIETKEEKYVVTNIDNYSEDMEYEEKIVCLQLQMLNSFNNIYNLLKHLQRQGHDMDETIIEFIKFYKIAKVQYSLRTRREYRPLFYKLTHIKETLCEGEVKEQLNDDIHKISASISGLIGVVMGDM